MASDVVVREEIVSGLLEAVAKEVTLHLIRSAYSPNIKERRDCSAAVCDADGKILALFTHGPAHLGSSIHVIPALYAVYPRVAIQPGDVFVANDPYTVGVTHLNDVTMVAPVFVHERLVAHVVSIAHQSDVGGRSPGSEAADSRTIFEEGLRMPPVRWVHQGTENPDLVRIMLANTRVPEILLGDLSAQRAATQAGAERVREIYRRYGTAQTEAVVGQYLEHTAQRISAILATKPAGPFEAQEHLEVLGTDTLLPLRVRLVRTDQHHLLVDLASAPPQVPTGQNVPLTHTLATIYFVVKALFDPNLPVNDGLFRIIECEIPAGTILNPTEPAAVSGRNPTAMILADALIQALNPIAGARAMAASGPFQGIILAGYDPTRRRFFVDYENYAGGAGAQSDGAGEDAVQMHMTNTSNLPIESMEQEFPLRVERFALRVPSGGNGRYRGGHGVIREVRVLQDGVVLATRGARQRVPAPGVAGGKAGACGAFFVQSADASQAVRVPAGVSNYPLKKGDMVRVCTPGGGGWGVPESEPSHGQGDSSSC